LLGQERLQAAYKKRKEPKDTVFLTVQKNDKIMFWKFDSLICL
jgi:hypothetical protein